MSQHYLNPNRETPMPTSRCDCGRTLTASPSGPLCLPCDVELAVRARLDTYLEPAEVAEVARRAREWTDFVIDRAEMEKES